MSDYEIRESSFQEVSWNPLEPDKVMWRSDRRLWWAADGKLIPEKNGRIPVDAVQFAAGVGGQVPFDIACACGLVDELKSEERRDESNRGAGATSIRRVTGS